MRADSMVPCAHIEQVLKERLGKKHSIGIVQPIDDDSRATFIVQLDSENELRIWRVDSRSIRSCALNHRFVKTLESQKYASGYAVYLVSSR